MSKRILITGGAGFIGRHVTQALLQRGYEPRIYDSLLPQVHGRHAQTSGDAELITGDIRDSDALKKTLIGIDAVIHLAAEVGVGQSMYAIERYVSVNDCGTATLLQLLSDKPVEAIITASSMSVYGEGLYRTIDGQLIEEVQAPAQGFDPLDARGNRLQPVPTPETKRPVLSSVYALTKYVQERLTLTVAQAYGMRATALRLFNVYGPGQALSNPYTGVLAIFAARLLNNKPPLIFEDGHQQRDFVHVEDVARAFVAALDTPAANGGVLNIASGQGRTIASVAQDMSRAMGREIAPHMTGKRRSGDIRHCLADISLARDLLAYEPQRNFQQGLEELAAWVATQSAEDLVPLAARELEMRGLVA